MFRLCASERACVCLYALHTFHRLSVDRKIFQLFYFSGKVFYIFSRNYNRGRSFVCVYFLSSLHAPAQTLSPHSFSLSLFFSLSRSLDADIINIRLVICFPKYFMQCCVYSSISERLVYSLFVCFVSFCFVCSYRCVSIFFAKSSSVFLYFFNCHHHTAATTANSFECYAHAHASAFAS